MVQLELCLSARNLKNVAGVLHGTSDPFAVVTKLATSRGAKAEVMGKTEVVKNSLSPQWTSVFAFDYELGTPMKVVVSIFDGVSKGDDKGMGAAVFDIGAIVGARGNTRAKKVKGGGTVVAHVRKCEGSGQLRLKMKGIDLKNTEGWFRKSDPFYQLNRKIDGAGSDAWGNVFRSTIVKDNLSPHWRESVVELSTLCGGHQDLPIQVQVFDYESDGAHVLMGEVETSVTGLLEAASSGSPMTLEKAGNETGTIVVEEAEVNVDRSEAFFEYISGGCQLDVVVAIDFTGSNGDPSQPGTLHHFHSDGGLNDYEKASSSIVDILEKYDANKMFPVFGFGAKYDGVVDHAFQCGESEEVHGAQGVLDAYHATFESGLTMSSPTDITHVIQKSAERAETKLEEALASDGQTFTILLILTDGAVSDVDLTTACLQEVSDKPMSIVIVGIGGADFSAMQFLDDFRKQDSCDIVQFVEFNEHSRNAADLSSATLKEVPNQLVAYFQKRGIEPMAKVEASEEEIDLSGGDEEEEAEEEEIDLSLDVGEDEIVVSGGGNAMGKW